MASSIDKAPNAKFSVFCQDCPVKSETFWLTKNLELHLAAETMYNRWETRP